jgi:VWFA-related protein
MRRNGTAVIAALLFALPLRAAAQNPPLFSSESDLVVLHATVKDTRGGYISGLTREAFGVVEDGRPQNIQLFSSEDAATTVGLLIDSSGSVLPNRERIIAAAAAFARTIRPGDEIFALAFNDTVEAALPPAHPFTSDADVLRAALAGTIRARGQTALFDAVAAGLDYLERGRHERRVLVVVSDGGDNASHITFDEVVKRTQASNVVIYTVGLVDSPYVDHDGNPRLLARLADASGGEAFEPRRADDVDDVLQHIARDIRQSYTLGYVSTNTLRDGAFRRVRLSVKAANQRRLVVRTRGGYVAGLPRAGRMTGDR